MSLAAAAAKLGALVHGRLIGIRIVRHGVSPRIIEASVIASHGDSPVSGAALQSRFGLNSTDVAFTTITTDGSRGGLAGSVFPAAVGATIIVQQHDGRAWRTVSRVSIGRGGAYRAPLTAPGGYRVLAGGLRGPTVGAG